MLRKRSAGTVPGAAPGPAPPPPPERPWGGGGSAGSGAVGVQGQGLWRYRPRGHRGCKTGVMEAAGQGAVGCRPRGQGAVHMLRGCNGTGPGAVGCTPRGQWGLQAQGRWGLWEVQVVWCCQGPQDPRISKVPWVDLLSVNGEEDRGGGHTPGLRQGVPFAPPRPKERVQMNVGRQIRCWATHQILDGSSDVGRQVQMLGGSSDVGRQFRCWAAAWIRPGPLCRCSFLRRASDVGGVYELNTRSARSIVTQRTLIGSGI